MRSDGVVTATVVAQIGARLDVVLAEEGCEGELVEESFSPTTVSDGSLRHRLEGILPAAPILDTGAGYDAGVLAAREPTATLFVRNPTGLSHSPEEHADDVDAVAGASALADVLQGLATVRSMA